MENCHNSAYKSDQNFINDKEAEQPNLLIVKLVQQINLRVINKSLSFVYLLV